MSALPMPPAIVAWCAKWGRQPTLAEKFLVRVITLAERLERAAARIEAAEARHDRELDELRAERVRLEALVAQMRAGA